MKKIAFPLYFNAAQFILLSFIKKANSLTSKNWNRAPGFKNKEPFKQPWQLFHLFRLKNNTNMYF